MDFLDKNLLDCAGKSFPNAKPPQYPPVWCLPPSCVRLDGNRNLNPTSPKGIRRLFIADLVWLFYFDRLGIFQILGKILDDFAIKGQLPISNGSIFNRGKDDLIALVLEAMVL